MHGTVDTYVLAARTGAHTKCGTGDSRDYSNTQGDDNQPTHY